MTGASVRAVHVVSARSGPASRDVSTLVAAFPDASLLLTSDGRTLTLRRGADPIEARTFATPIEPDRHRSVEYDRCVEAWLEAHAAQLLCVHDLAGHGLGLIDVARRRGIPVIVSFGDLYPLHPSGALAPGAPPRGGGDTGAPAVEVVRWRAMMDDALGAADAFVFPSAFSRRLLRQHLPAIRWDPRRGRLLRPGHPPPPVTPRPTRPGPGPVRVLVLGDVLDPLGGLDTLLALARIDGGHALELHVVGEVAEALLAAPGIVRHTPRPPEVDAVVARIAPHVGLVPSGWSGLGDLGVGALLRQGLPVLAPAIGAPAEAIARTGAGWTFAPDDPRDARRALLEARADAWEARVAAVERWRLTIGVERTVQAWVDDHRALHRALHRARLRRRGEAADVAIA